MTSNFAPTHAFPVTSSRNNCFRRFARLAALSGIAAMSMMPLPAHSVSLSDTYFGGLNTYPGGPDVIGSQTFNTTSVDVTRSGTGNNTLNVTIHTYYAGAPGTSAALGTGYGSLFFSTTDWTPTGTGPSFATDQYQPNDWNFVFKLPSKPGSGSIGTTNSGLYAVGNVLAANLYAGNSSVVQTYTTENGIITMSNNAGDPVTYPLAGNNHSYFRQGQAVQFDPASGVDPIAAGTWAVNATSGSTEGSIVISIVDNGILGNSFALLWAMTCANDVIQGVVSLPPGEDFPTPLPAALPLFAGGLGVMGFVGWRRKRKAVAAV